MILVGHCYGGVSVARVTERYVGKIHVAVYIAGCMLCSEQPMSKVWPEVPHLNKIDRLTAQVPMIRLFLRMFTSCS